MPFYKPEEIDNAQEKINSLNDKFNETLGKDHKKKIKAIMEAFSLFKEAGLPVILFAQHRAINSEGKEVMVQYNNFREISLANESSQGEPAIVFAVRFMKNFALSAYGFIYGFVSRLLAEKKILASESHFPAIYFGLYSYLDTTDLNTIKASEDEFVNKLKIKEKNSLN